MYTGGYVNEFEVIMAAGNGDISQVRGWTFFFWALMIIIALVAIKVQLDNRSTNLDAFQYKARSDGQRMNYDMIMNRAQKGGRDSENAYFNGRR